MATVTSPADVVSRLGRPLTTDEETLAPVLLADAERMLTIRGLVLDEDEEVHADLELVKQVAANAAVRVLRNPDGYRSETAGGVSYTIDTRAAAGFLTILDDEWRLLGLVPLSRSGSNAGSFAPVLGTPAWSSPIGWSPWL